MFLLFADIKVLQPVLNNNIMNIGTDQIHVNKTNMLNPSIADFNRDVNLTIRITAITYWTRVTCEDVQAVFATQRDNLYLDCKESSLKWVEFTMPENGT